MKKLIHNATIVDSSSKVFEGSLLIDGDKIKEVRAGSLPIDSDIDETIDASGRIVIPGMVNAHYHSYSNVLKGTTNNLPLEIWSLYTVAYGHSLTEEELELAVLLGAIEMIKNGTTACIDHYPHLVGSNAALKAYEKTGMRIGFAPMMHDVPDHHFLNVKLPNYFKKKLDDAPRKSVGEVDDYYRGLIEAWHNKNGNIEIMLGPNAPQRCSSDMLNLCRELSEEFGLAVHTHLLETKGQLISGVETFPDGIFGHLKEHGLLSEKLSVAHAVILKNNEIELLRGHGVTVVHNPASNMTLGSGKAPIHHFLNETSKLAIGTDASNCGTQHNLFEAMRLAAMWHRVDEPDYQKWPQSVDVWRMATAGGAGVFSNDSVLGRITEGAAADLVFLKATGTSFTPLQDPVTQLVFQENGRSVDSVMVAGEWVMKDGSLTTLNEREILEEVRERTEHLMSHSKQQVELADQLAPYFKQRYDELQRENYN
ncbi:amidohydrolase family protein [Alkalihalobacillus sp. AL-G]|uniref:amidohydrolase family protein n=1 Tax=Alkalihalobacillus sp. AL-G TaxID=2926399 RepID=UPI00272A69D2|nr:amidohydrolase family protein [Alkalihalobacillus sp. AL-G]WLD93586.1 amidohydrolase family protein [Alkalihalobacillus sp. AL-G]